MHGVVKPNVPLSLQISERLRDTAIWGFDDSTGHSSLYDLLSLITFNAGLMEYKLFGMTLMANPPFIAERLKKIPDVIRSSPADVIALQEVYLNDDAKYIASSLADIYPFCDRVYNGVGSGNCCSLHCGLMILSKWPIVKTRVEKFSRGTFAEKFVSNKGFQETTIKHPAAGLLTIFNLHTASAALDPDGIWMEALRQHQIEQCMVSIGRAKQRGESVIFLGDFNAGPESSTPNYEYLVRNGWRDMFLEAHTDPSGAPDDALILAHLANPSDKKHKHEVKSKGVKNLLLLLATTRVRRDGAKVNKEEAKWKSKLREWGERVAAPAEDYYERMKEKIKLARSNHPANESVATANLRSPHASQRPQSSHADGCATTHLDCNRLQEASHVSSQLPISPHRNPQVISPPISPTRDLVLSPSKDIQPSSRIASDTLLCIEEEDDDKISRTDTTEDNNNVTITVPYNDVSTCEGLASKFQRLASKTSRGNQDMSLAMGSSKKNPKLSDESTQPPTTAIGSSSSSSNILNLQNLSHVENMPSTINLNTSGLNPEQKTFSFNEPVKFDNSLPQNSAFLSPHMQEHERPLDEEGSVQDYHCGVFSADNLDSSYQSDTNDNNTGYSSLRPFLAIGAAAARLHALRYSSSFNQKNFNENNPKTSSPAGISFQKSNNKNQIPNRGIINTDGFDGYFASPHEKYNDNRGIPAGHIRNFSLNSNESFKNNFLSISAYNNSLNGSLLTNINNNNNHHHQNISHNRRHSSLATASATFLAAASIRAVSKVQSHNSKDDIAITLKNLEDEVNKLEQPDPQTHHHVLLQSQRQHQIPLSGINNSKNPFSASVHEELEFDTSGPMLSAEILKDPLRPSKPLITASKSSPRATGSSVESPISPSKFETLNHNMYSLSSGVVDSSVSNKGVDNTEFTSTQNGGSALDMNYMYGKNAIIAPFSSKNGVNSVSLRGSVWEPLNAPQAITITPQIHTSDSNPMLTFNGNSSADILPIQRSHIASSANDPHNINNDNNYVVLSSSKTQNGNKTIQHVEAGELCISSDMVTASDYHHNGLTPPPIENHARTLTNESNNRPAFSRTALPHRGRSSSAHPAHQFAVTSYAGPLNLDGKDSRLNPLLLSSSDANNPVNSTNRVPRKSSLPPGNFQSTNSAYSSKHLTAARGPSKGDNYFDKRLLRSVTRAAMIEQERLIKVNNLLRNRKLIQKSLTSNGQNPSAAGATAPLNHTHLANVKNESQTGSNRNSVMDENKSLIHETGNELLVPPPTDTVNKRRSSLIFSTRRSITNIQSISSNNMLLDDSLNLNQSNHASFAQYIHANRNSVISLNDGNSDLGQYGIDEENNWGGGELASAVNLLLGHLPYRFTWCPRNPLNAVGIHAKCAGQRCDHIFLPPKKEGSILSEFTPIASEICFVEAVVNLNENRRHLKQIEKQKIKEKAERREKRIEQHRLKRAERKRNKEERKKQKAAARAGVQLVAATPLRSNKKKKNYDDHKNAITSTNPACEGDLQSRLPLLEKDVQSSQNLYMRSNTGNSLNAHGGGGSVISDGGGDQSSDSDSDANSSSSSSELLDSDSDLDAIDTFVSVSDHYGVRVDLKKIENSNPIRRRTQSLSDLERTVESEGLIL